MASLRDSCSSLIWVKCWSNYYHYYYYSCYDIVSFPSLEHGQINQNHPEQINSISTKVTFSSRISPKKMRICMFKFKCRSLPQYRLSQPARFERKISLYLTHYVLTDLSFGFDILSHNPWKIPKYPPQSWQSKMVD